MKKKILAGHLRKVASFLEKIACDDPAVAKAIELMQKAGKLPDPEKFNPQDNEDHKKYLDTARKIIGPIEDEDTVDEARKNLGDAIQEQEAELNKTKKDLGLSS